MTVISLRKKIKVMKKPLVIFICGMPGTRKSSTAIRLASNLGIKVVIGTDQIRDIVKYYVNDPFLHQPTHNCWRLIGSRTSDNIIAGYLRQSILIKQGVLSALRLAEKRGENMIFEGVHLAPSFYLGSKNVLDTHASDLAFFYFLLWTKDENLHSKNIAMKIRLRHGKEAPWSEEKKEEIRAIQEYLFTKLHLGIHSIESTTPEANVRTIIKILEASL